MNGEYVQEGAGNFLRVVSSEKECFADEMFSYQEIPGFLPVEIRKINGKKEIFYDVTGMVSLICYLKENCVSLSEMKEIISQIFHLQDELEEYLLDGRGLLIHPEYLYIEKEGGKVWGIYHDGSCDGDTAAVGRFLESVMEVMNPKDRELTFFIYDMHKFTKSVGCTGKDLRAFLQKEEGERMKKREKSIPCLPRMEKREKAEKKESEKKIPMLSLTVMVIAVGIPVCLYAAGVFALPLSGRTDTAKMVGAVMFFLLTGGYAAWKFLPENPRFGIRSLYRCEEEEEWGEICLVPEKTGEEMIPIPSFPFRIGRDRAHTDACLGGNGVSALHLQILFTDGSFYAVDQESSEGTLHNEKRMVPWQKEELHDGDFLTIGSHEFVVEITSVP